MGSKKKRRSGKTKKQGRRSTSPYVAAQQGRLQAGWAGVTQIPDNLAQQSLQTIRARSREQAINNDYVRKYLALCVTNIVGPTGITLQSRVVDWDTRKPDKVADVKIESAWKEWSKKSNSSTSGELSFRDIEELAVRAVARDGECLIRIVRGFKNPFKFALQLIEADHLDENLNELARNGNEIKAGIEVDEWGRRSAYWVDKRHPNDTLYSQSHRKKLRIPASDIIHLYVPDRIGQNRGMPWLAASLARLKNLAGYEEAEIIAARVAASKMGLIISPPGEDYEGDNKDESGNAVIDVEPGTFDQLPVGYDFKTYDPTHPAGNYAPFIKATLRGISAGLLVSYNSLASDLEGVNYSSGRIGSLEERDMWRVMQQWLIESLHAQIYPEWLKFALLSGQLALPFSKYDRFNAATWQPRGWDWVDPLKDMNAAVKAVNGGLKTRRQVLAEKGQDLEDTFAQLAEEEALAKKYGLDLSSQKDITIPATNDNTGN